MVHVGFIVLQTLCDDFVIRTIVNIRLFSIIKVHPATVAISLMVAESHHKTVIVSGINFQWFRKYLFFTERYKSVNALCVAVNAKPIQLCVRSTLYWMYEVNGKSVRSQQVKVYAVKARTILVLNYVSPFRVGRQIVFVFTVFCPPVCPNGCLSVTTSCPLYSLKPFMAFLWHLKQT